MKQGYMGWEGSNVVLYSSIIHINSQSLGNTKRDFQ